MCCKYSIGDSYSKSIRITEENVNNFAEVTGDNNPIHLDKNFASKTFFKKRIAHGFLYGSYISAIIGTEFPGKGTVYISQQMQFLRPVYIDDILSIKIEVLDILPKDRLSLQTDIYNHKEQIVLKGTAIVSLAKP